MKYYYLLRNWHVPRFFERFGGSRFACTCAVHVLAAASKKNGGHTYQHYFRDQSGGWEVAAAPCGKIEVSA